MGSRITSHRELHVYDKAFDAAMKLFGFSKRFPKEETYSLTDQMRKSSRSVCANLAEAWRKRRYQAAFISKLSDAEAEAAESQVWIEFAVNCTYLKRDEGADVYRVYDEVIRMIVCMINDPQPWILKK